MTNLPASTLTKHQTKTLYKEGFRIDGGYGRIMVTIRYDDSCGNGHNSFAITANITRNSREWVSGCCHDEILEYFPELNPLIKWHLCGSDGPMHYIANTTYHASGYSSKMAHVYFGDEQNGIRKQYVKYTETEKAIKMCKADHYTMKLDEKTGKVADLKAARNSAIWPNATAEQLLDKEALQKRLPALLKRFKKDVESLGFTY